MRIIHCAPFNIISKPDMLSDTDEHFKYWKKLFGTYQGQHFVFPVLADKDIYYPLEGGLKNKPVKVLFYGSFIPLHGIDIILEDFKLMEQNSIRFEAKIIGTGQMYNKKKDLFETLDLKQVQMNGEIIQEKELVKEIREHDIILGIFGNSTKAKSVVPNKVYQALASKKTIVTMRSEAINEFFNGNDLITCNHIPEVLSQELTRLIDTPQLLDDVTLNGYNKFLNLYDRIKSDFENFIYMIDKKLEGTVHE